MFGAVYCGFMKLVSHKLIYVLIVIVCIVFSEFSALATDVGGIISSDTTWSLANSPYIMTSNVQVPEGITLIAGDIDGDRNVDLVDVLLALQIMAGIEPASIVFRGEFKFKVHHNHINE
jgi:hypothetical protein